MLRRFGECQRKLSTPVTYKADITGTARIIFDEKTMKLEGALVGENDRCFTFHGYVVRDEKQQSNSMSANFGVLDSETNHNFKIDNVSMKLDTDPETAHRNLILEHDSFKFVTKKWLHGYRADIEISEHINPKMAAHGCSLFIGDIKISIISTHYFVPLKRSLSVADGDVIESSNDFLA
uniref:Uncharacterized protein n=1 Tax=Onchocerca volvulus TaxID=6282 RepID=A0A8R1XQE5_ONCVO